MYTVSYYIMFNVCWGSLKSLFQVRVFHGLHSTLVKSLAVSCGSASLPAVAGAIPNLATVWINHHTSDGKTGSS